MTRGIARGQHVSEDKKELAKSLRNNQTEAEKVLWYMIKGKQVNGRRFRRQQIIDGYIADFYCPQIGLVIELDGGAHRGQKDYDEKRDNAMAGLNLKVVRFSNDEVLNRIDSVIERLKRLTE